MDLKNILKKFLPATFSYVDKRYTKLVKQNEEIIKLLSKEQIKLAKILENEKDHNNRYKRISQQLWEIESLAGFEQYGVTEEKRTPQIVVSLTSYGDRIYLVASVIERLLCQSLKPDRIVVYLSTDNFPNRESDMPPRLLDLQKYGVELRWCEGDIKSYKKIVPALKEFPDDIIITVDDDLHYRLDMIERLYCSYMRFPNAISALRVHKMTFDDEGMLKPYAEWQKVYRKEILMPGMQLFATTGAGTLFPPHCLYEDMCKEEIFMQLAPTADDVWVKMMSLLAHTPVVLAADFGGIQCVEGTQQDRLWDINITENDNQINRVLEWYRDIDVEGTTLIDILKDVKNEADRNEC